MLIPIALILLSLGLLTAGAEGLVRGSSSLALRAGLTPLVIGLTVVAFGTSAPELVVSLKSALGGLGDLAVGNVVGSNIFNIGIILGITALVCPVPVKLQIVKLDAPAMVLVALALPVLLIGGTLGRWEGAFLLLALAAYTAFNVRQARREVRDTVTSGFVPPMGHWLRDIFFLAGGLVLLVFGSRLLVDNCILLARLFEVSEAVIGLTIVAAGTSMPELATSLIAAFRKEPDIAIGNVIGSNIFNILGILGAASLVAPLTAHGIQLLDYLVMIGFSLLLLPVLWSGLRVRRLEGLFLLLAYSAYFFILWPKG